MSFYPIKDTSNSANTGKMQTNQTALYGYLSFSAVNHAVSIPRLDLPYTLTVDTKQHNSLYYTFPGLYLICKYFPTLKADKHYIVSRVEFSTYYSLQGHVESVRMYRVSVCGVNKGTA